MIKPGNNSHSREREREREGNDKKKKARRTDINLLINYQPFHLSSDDIYQSCHVSLLITWMCAAMKMTYYVVQMVLHVK